MGSKVVTTNPDVASPTQNQRISNFVIFQLLLLGVGFSFYALNRFAFPIGLRDIGKAFHFSVVQTSTLGTAFLLGQGLIDIPAGYLAGKLNRRFLFFLGMLGIGATVLGFTMFTVGFASALIWRVTFGMMEGIFNISLFALIGVLLPNRRALLNNLTQCFFGIGAFGGPVVFGMLTKNSGQWRHPLEIFAAATMVYALILYAALRIDDKNIPTLAFCKIKTPVGETFWSALAAVGRLPSMWKALIIPCFNLVSYWSFAGVGAYILINTKHVDTAFAGTVIGTAFGLSVFLCPLMGYFGDKFGRKIVIVGLAVMILICLYVLFISNVTNRPLLLAIACLAGLGYNSNYALGYTIVQDAVPLIYVGFATGLTGAFGYFTASLSGYFVGVIINSLGYHAAIYIVLMGGVAMVAIFGLLFLPSKPKISDIA